MGEKNDRGEAKESHQRQKKPLPNTFTIRTEFHVALEGTHQDIDARALGIGFR